MTKNPKLLIAVAAMLAATAAFWFLVLTPKREEAASLETKSSAKQTELDAAKTALAGYEKSRENYSENYATMVRLGKAVPEDDDVRSLMVQLDAEAGGTGVDFRTIQVGGGSSAAASTASTGTGAAGTPPPGAVSVGAAGFSAMPFTFSFRGTFGNLSKFFSGMERFVTLRNERMNVSGRLLRLESIDLQVDQTGFPNIRAQIGASSYLVPPGQGITAGASPQGPAATTPAGTTPAGTTPAAPAGGPAVPTTTSTVTGATP